MSYYDYLYATANNLHQVPTVIISASDPLLATADDLLWQIELPE